MQNRNMFLYRRQGPKKRAKPNAPRKNRGPQKGLPNSARDLLPLIQPATKALAQMLAGRTGASGQLGHARAVLAQTERLVSDRAHNRLNPAEREEFFEQVARLKLTLADAESEAEVQAQEDDAPVATPMPVNRERLKEMAMALTSPGGPTSYEDRHKSDTAELAETPEAELSEESSPADIAEPEEPASTPAKPDDPNQLRLPRAGAERVAIQPDAIRPRAGTRRRISKSDGASARATTLAVSSPTEPKSAPAAAKQPEAEKVAADQSASDLDAKQKLPKGWIIDDDGFVVPGPAV